MWAVVEAGEPLVLLKKETPEPQGSEVLLEVTHCGVCHSDLHFWEGEYDMGGGKRMKLAERGVELPRAPGHEIAGIVVAVGPDVMDTKVGDRRIVYPWISCGDCGRCRAGQQNHCAKRLTIGVVSDGGFASHVIVPDEQFAVDPGNADPAVAATYACSGITVYSAIRQLEIDSPDSPVLLIGAGGLGHSAIAILRGLGHRNIIVSDVDDAKRQGVLEAGATAFINGRTSDLATEIGCLTQSDPLRYAIDFVNNAITARAAYESLGRGGKLVLIGMGGGEITLSLTGSIFIPRTVIGSSVGTVQDLRDVLKLAHEGRLKPIPTLRMAKNQANEALHKLQAGAFGGRIILQDF